MNKLQSRSWRVGQNQSECKIPPFDEQRHSLDAFLERFERIVVSQRYPSDLLALHLSSVLREKALDAYAQLSGGDAMDYNKLKMELLKRYQMTEEGYRNKFRNCRPERGETPSQFAMRLIESMDRDGKLSERL